MKTTYDALLEMDIDGVAHVMTLVYLCGKTRQEESEDLMAHEDYDAVKESFVRSLDMPYEEGLWTLDIQSPVLPGDDLWWVCDEPPYVRCAKKNVKAVCAWENGEIRIINSDNGIEELHERWTCVTKEEAVEKFKEMVRNKEIDPELDFEGITELSEDEMMRRLEDIDALVEDILNAGGNKDE